MTLLKVSQLAAQSDTDVVNWKSQVEDEWSNEQQASEETNIYQITGDNLDLEVKTKVMTLSRQKSLHWFNMVATKDRVPILNSLPLYNVVEHTQPSIMSLASTAFLPSPTDDANFKSGCVELIIRVLCHHLKDLTDFQKCVVSHLPHKYTTEAAKQSVQVPLGILQLNENHQKDIIEILQRNNRMYVPHHRGVNGSHDPIIRVMFGGDQLTAERARNAQRAVVDGNTQYERIDSLIPKIEDFHAQMNFLDAIFQKFYSTSSCGDQGTLYHLRTVLNRRNVVKEPRKAYDACSKFLDGVLDGHILACSLAHFHLTSLDQSFVPNAVKAGNVTTKREWLTREIESMLDTCVQKFALLRDCRVWRSAGSSF